MYKCVRVYDVTCIASESVRDMSSEYILSTAEQPLRPAGPGADWIIGNRKPSESIQKYCFFLKFNFYMKTKIQRFNEVTCFQFSKKTYPAAIFDRFSGRGTKKPYIKDVFFKIFFFNITDHRKNDHDCARFQRTLKPRLSKNEK